MPDSRPAPTRLQGIPSDLAVKNADECLQLAAYLQRTREAERAALARELHDELGAILTAARLDVAWLAAQPGCQDPAIAQRVAALQRVLAEGIGLKRRIVEDLHPTVLTHLGLVPALEQLLSTHRPRFAGRIDVELDERISLTGEPALALYRIVQEALTNIHKYAEARWIRVSLRRARGRIELEIADDGRGFDVDGVGAGHHGLAGMRHRMLAVEGSFEVASAPGEGTLVRAVLPLQRRAAAEPRPAATTAPAARLVGALPRPRGARRADATPLHS